MEEWHEAAKDKIETVVLTTLFNGCDIAITRDYHKLRLVTIGVATNSAQWGSGGRLAVGKKAVARCALDDCRVDRRDKLSEVLGFSFTHGEDMKSKALGLSAANPGEFFKVSNQLIKTSHT
jgi:alpha-D-ribose 1-methylphosphonate 5-triphosphate synthase subunit PhnG